MQRRVAILVVLLSLGLTSVLYAVPFTNPPEDSGEAWIFPYPYQRNALIDFGTDVSGWDAHWSETDAWALDPADNYSLYGWDDYATLGTRAMWEYDWLKVDVTNGSVIWQATDPYFGSDREGLLLLQGTTPGETMSFTMEWNMANWVAQAPAVSHLWSEMYFAVNAEPDSTGSGIVLPDGYSDDGWFGYVPLNGGPWALMSAYVEVSPSPPWQRLLLQVSVTPPTGQPAIFMVDSWQTATEAPEPGTVALFGVGLAGLALWRRRRRKD